MDYHYFAAVNGYSCGAYGVDAYGEQCQTGVLPPDTGWQQFVGNVGYEVILPVALGAAVLIAALIALAKKMKRQK